MAKHIYAERRAYHRTEEVQDKSAEEEVQREHQEAINQEVAELDTTTDKVIEDIDIVLLEYGLGQIAVTAA